MIEQLLQGGKTQSVLPWSGPGNKTLKFGTEELGYFGTVTDDELFTTNEVLEFTGITAGNTITSGTFFWFKFILKGRIIYIRSLQMKTTVTWADLYNAGLVYGTADDGLFPLSPPVKQLKWKIKEEGAVKWFLKARTMTGMGVDPYTDPNSSLERIGSEFDELLGRVCIGSSPNAGAWEKYQLAVLGIVANVFDITAETYSVVTTSSLLRAYGTITGTNKNKTQVRSSDRWRPVLELFDGGILAIEPNDVVGRLTDGIEAPKVFNTNITGDATISPQVVSGEVIPDITPPDTFTAEQINPVVAPRAVHGVSDFKQVTLSFTTV